MNESLEWYAAEARAQCHAAPAFHVLQEEGLRAFLQARFPTRALEDWKYTPVDFLQKIRFARANGAAAVAAQSVPEWFAGCHVIPVTNGVCGRIPDLPAGIEVLPLGDAVEKYPAEVMEHLGKVMQTAHGLDALNSAMLGNGVFLRIGAQAKIDAPIVLSHWQDRPEEAAFLRHLVIAEAGSDAELIEYYASAEDCPCHTNVVTEVALAGHAALSHLSLRDEGRETRHIAHTFARLMTGARLESHVFGVGGSLVRADVSVDLAAPGASCMLNGVYLPKAGEHVDHHTTVHHRVAECESAQDYRGVLAGRSHGVFNGRVVVHPGADKSRALQQNRNLLLAADAVIDTKPQLEIFADDVQCSHGATVGQLDKDALFYLAARGIAPEMASAFLIRGFVTANLKQVRNPRLAEWLDARLVGGNI